MPWNIQFQSCQSLFLYNASLFLSKAIESVLAQTFTDFELLIVDDGSTDNTASIANHYCQYDSRVDFFPSKQGSAARNVGVHMTQGKLVACRRSLVAR